MDLEAGDVICPQCHGTGWNPEYYNNPKDFIKKYKQYYRSCSWCDKCHGLGKLDWIENVVGRSQSIGGHPKTPRPEI